MEPACSIGLPPHLSLALQAASPIMVRSAGVVYCFVHRTDTAHGKYIVNQIWLSVRGTALVAPVLPAISRYMPFYGTVLHNQLQLLPHEALLS